MGHVLFRIYGPFAIYSYGLAIAIGAAFFIWFVQRDKRFATLKLQDSFSDIFLLGLLSALIGGRLLHVFGSAQLYDHWLQLFAFWEAGFSVLGSIVGVVLVVPFFLRRKSIPVLSFFDLIATYSGLLQGISRFGCFFAGCCFGCPSNALWSICYTDPESMAPLCVSMHPTQLYSALLLLTTFLFMYYVVRHVCRIPGQQVAVYLMCAGAERFIVDFFRGDREYLAESTFTLLSLHQILAMIICIGAACGFVWVTYASGKKQ